MATIYIMIAFIITGWTIARTYKMVLKHLGKRLRSYLLMVPIAFMEIYILGVSFLYLYRFIVG